MIALLSMVANAQDVYLIDGIYYNLDPSTNTASVTYKEDGSATYSGYVKIPEEVTYEGTNYSVTSIGEKAFYKCSGLTSVIIPNSITTIGESAFQACSGLTSVTIPTKVIEIGSFAFYGCSGLTSMTIPNNVTTIGRSAFRDCSSLTSVSIPNSVTTIGGSVFRNCSSLTSVNIPNNVNFIGGAAFYNCSSLTSVNIPNGITSINGSTFRNCSSLTSLTIPQNITSIENYAFSGCSSLTSVTIPESVTSIYEGAFSGCSNLTAVIIPNTLNNIPNKLFANCSSLKDVYCYIEHVPTTAGDAFDDTPIGSATLHVPDSGVNEYKAIMPWSKFGTIVGLGILKCAIPSIQYANGMLTFNSETEGAVCESTITNTDINSYSGNEVKLCVTYNIRAYATKDGYENSNAATATLCWVDVEPRTEGISNSIAQVKAQAVLIQSDNGMVTVSGVDDDTTISAYNVSGQMLGTAKASGNQAKLNTNLRQGEIAIVKVGNKSIKVIMR